MTAFTKFAWRSRWSRACIYDSHISHFFYNSGISRDRNLFKQLWLCVLICLWEFSIHHRRSYWIITRRNLWRFMTVYIVQTSFTTFVQYDN